MAKDNVPAAAQASDPAAAQASDPEHVQASDPEQQTMSKPHKQVVFPDSFYLTASVRYVASVLPSFHTGE